MPILRMKEITSMTTEDRNKKLAELRTEGEAEPVERPVRGEIKPVGAAVHTHQADQRMRPVRPVPSDIVGQPVGFGPDTQVRVKCN